MPEIEIIDLDCAYVLLSDNEIVEITNYFDDEGDECDPCDAFCVVAGPTLDGHWLTIEITKKPVLH